MDQPHEDHFVKLTQFTKKAYRDLYAAMEPSSPALSQAGKIVIIIGASRGIGSPGIATAFALSGPKAIVLVARKSESLEETEAAIKFISPNVETLLVGADLANPASVKELFEQVAARFGHSDVLNYNAAIMQDLQPSMILTSTSGREKSTSKSAALRLMDLVAVEYPNVTAVSLSPGIVRTDNLQPLIERFALDTPMLTGGAAIWLCTETPRFTNGRYIMANWDVVALNEREEEIKQKGLLPINQTGTFGPDQFNGQAEVIH